MYIEARYGAIYASHIHILQTNSTDVLKIFGKPTYLVVNFTTAWVEVLHRLALGVCRVH